MNVKEICNLINDVERKHNVDRMVMDGIELWPIIRIICYFKAFIENDKQLDLTSKSSKTAKLLRFMSNIFLTVVDIFAKQPNTSNATNIVFYHTENLERQKASLFHRTLDPIYLELIEDNIPVFGITTIKRIQNGITKKEYFPGFFTLKLRNKLTLHFSKKKILRRFKENSDIYIPIKALSDKLNINLEETLTTVIQFAVALRSQLPYFRKMLSSYKVRNVFFDNYYNPTGMALCKICNELGINTLEIQHGTHADYHIAYGSWERVPPKGFSVLPKYFLVWSAYEKNILEKSFSKCGSHKPVVIGNRYENRLPPLNDFSYKTFVEKTQDKINVLISLQNGYGLPIILKEFIESCPASWNLWIRFHPMTPKEEVGAVLQILKNINKNNIYLNEASELPLHIVARHINLNITLNSSTVIDCKSAGVKSIVCDETALIYYKNEISDDTVRYCPDSKIALAEAHKITGSEPQEVPKEDSATTIKFSRILAQNGINLS